MRGLFRCAAILALCCGGPALAQEFPARPVTMIVPSAPGGTLDALGRLMAQGMAADLGQNVVVENVSGAGSIVGMQRLVRSPADGYVIGFGNLGSLAANVAITRELGFDPRQDLTPISIVANVPMVIAVSNKSGVRDLAALLSRIRERGDGVTFGTPGTGTTGHLAPAYLLSLTKLQATLVPYRGAGPAMGDLASGTVDAVIDQTVTMIPAHRGNTAFALAVTGPQRLAQLPDVPTFAEAGVPGFDMVIWNAIVGPRGIPEAAQQRLVRAVEAALASPNVTARFADLATTAPPAEERGPEVLRRRIAEDVDRWIRITREAGITPQ